MSESHKHAIEKKCHGEKLAIAGDMTRRFYFGGEWTHGELIAAPETPRIGDRHPYVLSVGPSWRCIEVQTFMVYPLLHEVWCIYERDAESEVK